MVLHWHCRKPLFGTFIVYMEIKLTSKATSLFRGFSHHWQAWKVYITKKKKSIYFCHFWSAKQHHAPLAFIVWTKTLWHSAHERKSGFEMTRGWGNYDRNFIWGWTIPLIPDWTLSKCKLPLFYHSVLSLD